MNEIVLIGRVAEEPEIRTTSKGNTVASLIVETDRNFRNEDGTVGTDVFNVTLWKGKAEECRDQCRPGDLISIRGRIQGTSNVKNDRRWFNTEIIAEQVDFLTRHSAIHA